MKVLFLGSSRFSSFVLSSVLASKHSVCGVITQPPRPSGRGQKLEKTLVHKQAEENNIPVFTFDRLSRHLDEVRQIDYDIALVASYGQILSDEFLAINPCINVHPSLLPKYRGATPIQSALINGDKETGVTIMKVAREVDAGDIILQEKFDLNEDIRFEELERSLSLLGGKLAVEAIDLYQSGKVTFTPQDHSKAVLVRKITKEDGLLNFAKTSTEIYNKFRALSEFVGCYIFIGGQKIKVFDLKIVGMQGNPCEVLSSKKRFIIACKDKAIEILRLQSPSGKAVDALSFLNGWKGEIEVNKCLQI